jgi:predicted transcriptional regulator
VADDHLVCLEDGKTFKSLKRHLQTVHGMTPDQYRERWGLNRDYPMVAPAYAKARSALAKGMGLGASRRRAANEDVEANSPAAAPSEATPAKKPRGPRAKAARSSS